MQSEHRATGWAAIGATLATVGVAIGTCLGLYGASSHLWGDWVFLVGFALACVLFALGIYVLVAEFIGRIGPLQLPLPQTRLERVAAKNQQEQENRKQLPRHPQVASSLVASEELLAEGEAMLQDANAIHVMMHGSSEYGPPTNEKIDSWKLRVSQSLPETYRRRFQSPPREPPAGEVFRLLVHGHEQKEVRRLRRHVEVLKHFLEEMLDDQPQPQTESLDAWLDSRALDMRKLGDRLQELLAKTPFNGERARSIQVSFLQVNDDVLTRLHTDGPEWAAELFMENPSGVPLELTLVTSDQFRRYTLPLMDATINQIEHIRAGLREGRDEP